MTPYAGRLGAGAIGLSLVGATHAVTLEPIVSREDPEPDCTNAEMTVGRDGNGYLASNGYVLRISRDGTQTFGGDVARMASRMHRTPRMDVGREDSIACPVCFQLRRELRSGRVGRRAVGIESLPRVCGAGGWRQRGDGARYRNGRRSVLGAHRNTHSEF